MGDASIHDHQSADRRFQILEHLCQGFTFGSVTFKHFRATDKATASQYPT
jgi:hypothetical protein